MNAYDVKSLIKVIESYKNKERIIIYAGKNLIDELKDILRLRDLYNVKVREFPLPDLEEDKVFIVNESEIHINLNDFNTDYRKGYHEELSEVAEKYREDYLSEIDLKKKIKYSKNPLEKQRLERELGYRCFGSRRNKSTKKNKHKRRK